MIFSYRGRDVNGALVEGEMEANSSAEVRAKLDQQGVIVTRINQSSSRTSKKFGGTKRDWRQFFAKAASLDDLILFCRQMYSLNKAGIPLIRGFTGLAESYSHAGLKDALFGIADGLKQGNDLATSMSAYPKYFSGIFISMIRVGESTGRLDLAFKQLVDYLELEKNTKRRVRKATGYPTMIIIALVIAITVINVMVIPNFSAIFNRMGADLPLPTKILMVTSNFLINYWWILLAIIAGSIGSAMVYVRTPEGELAKDKLKFKLPLVGELIRKITLTRFTRPFAMMIDSGVPMLQALGISSRTVGNRYLGEAIAGMSERIEQGESLMRAAAATNMFNPVLLQMIAVGEETGQVGTMLKEISDFYDEEVEFNLETLQSRMEPIVLLIMGVMVLILATGVFLPLWDLYGAFS